MYRGFYGILHGYVSHNQMVLQISEESRWPWLAAMSHGLAAWPGTFGQRAQHEIQEGERTGGPSRRHCRNDIGLDSDFRCRSS